MLIKLTLSTAAGLFLVLVLFGQSDQTKQPQSPVAEVLQPRVPLLSRPQPTLTEQASAPAAIITPLFTNSAPRPALVASPEFRAAASPATEEKNDIRTVTADALIVRARPSGASTRVDSIARGDEVLVISEQGGWAKIRVEGDGIDGWVSAKFLK